MLSLDRTTHERLTADLPASLRSVAADAFSQYETSAMPSAAEENWRYVDVPDRLEALTIADSPGAAATPSDIEARLSGSNERADIVDGHVVSLEGPHVSTLDLTEIEPVPSSGPPDRFAAAAVAFGGAGVVVSAERAEQVTEPIFVSTEATMSGAVSIPRVFVRAAEASAVEVIIEQRSRPGVDALVLPDVDVMAEQGARASVTVIQTWGDETVAIGRYRFRAGRDAHVGLAEAGFGARFSRLHLDVELAGRGADARIVGAYFGDADQTLDYRYFMNHVGPNTTSEMFLKGAVAGAARSVFTGMIRIEPEGQGTNAHQTNRNLVLSDDAEAHSVPNLEILANDVRCGHGSAVGPLDEEQRYYLMSRGLPAPHADRLQVLGFFEDALQRFPRQDVEPTLRSAALEKYDRIPR